MGLRVVCIAAWELSSETAKRQGALLIYLDVKFAISAKLVIL